MTHGVKTRWHVGLALFALAAVGLAVPGTLEAQQGSADAEVTFSRDIAPILQRSCQNCHRPGGVAPMSLVTYDQVRRYGRRIKVKTGIRDRAGAMPP